MATNSSQMNYSSKVGSSSVPSTSSPIKEVYVDAVVYNRKDLISINDFYFVGCVKNNKTCS